jgi:hypothetical protein
LRAGLAGNPVCKESQTTQIINAPALKNSKVNQSIKALTLRFSVGKAKAAKVANAGKANNKERSPDSDKQVVKMTTVTNHKGKNKWGLAAAFFN